MFKIGEIIRWPGEIEGIIYRYEVVSVNDDKTLRVRSLREEDLIYQVMETLEGRGDHVWVNRADPEWFILDK